MLILVSPSPPLRSEALLALGSVACLLGLLAVA